jgi:hypothetical protein
MFNAAQSGKIQVPAKVPDVEEAENVRVPE